MILLVNGELLGGKQLTGPTVSAHLSSWTLSCLTGQRQPLYFDFNCLLYEFIEPSTVLHPGHIQRPSDNVSITQILKKIFNKKHLLKFIIIYYCYYLLFFEIHYFAKWFIFLVYYNYCILNHRRPNFKVQRRRESPHVGTLTVVQIYNFLYWDVNKQTEFMLICFKSQHSVNIIKWTYLVNMLSCLMLYSLLKWFVATSY